MGFRIRLITAKTATRTRPPEASSSWSVSGLGGRITPPSPVPYWQRREQLSLSENYCGFEELDQDTDLGKLGLVEGVKYPSMS